MNATRRDLGLDALRVVALFLMVAIHYFQRLPSPTPLTDFLNFVGESSAALFFFAFGLTFARFQSKSRLDKLDSNLMFMYVGLSHNLYLRGLFQIDFLFFLFLARVVVDAMGTLRNEMSAYLKISLGVMLLALLLPDKGSIDRLFMQAGGGFFPLLPWVVFVLLGALYAKWSPSRLPGALLGGGLIIVALAMGWSADALGRSSLEISKWPLTTPYILLFTGISILLLEGVRQIQGAIKARAWLCNPMVYVSKNLLLATVLQYLPLELLYWAGKHLAILQPGKQDETAVLIAIFLGSLVCQLLLLALLPVTINLWDRSKGARLFESLRYHRALTAIGLIGGTALLRTKSARAALASDVLQTPWKLAAAIAMIYFALELREWQLRKRTAAQPSI